MKLADAIKSNRFANEKHRASVNMLHTAYWLKDLFVTALKPHGITLEQHNVLRILKGSHPEQMRVKDIASRMVEKSSNVPRIIDKLVTKKLATRTYSEHDKRETFVSLTERGISVITQARKSIDEATQEKLMINEKEAELLNDLLEKMRG
jgi:DNA-binding MarR family transcriptional regulator